MRKKKVFVISPDAIPLKAKKEEFRKLSEQDKKLFTSKVLNSTAPGDRAYATAKQFSKKGFEVTLALPHYNYMFEECIDFSDVNFNLVIYDYDNARWNFSKDLSDYIEQSDYVVIQSTDGVGFDNVISCKHPKVIVDGWVPLGVEFATSITYTLEDDKEKEKVWNNFKEKYFKLLKRADLLLYANLSQKFYYYGLLNSIDDISFNKIRGTKLIKTPYSFDEVEPIEITRETDPFKIVFFGAVYPWYNAEILVRAYKHLKKENIKLSFIGSVHPRFKKYSQYVNELVSKDSDIEFIPDYVPLEFLKNYNIAVITAHNFVEKDLAHRHRIFNMGVHGIPVMSNRKDNAIFVLKKYGLGYFIETSTVGLLVDSILRVKEEYRYPDKSKVKELQKSLSHDFCFKFLFDALRKL